MICVKSLTVWCFRLIWRRFLVLVCGFFCNPRGELCAQLQSLVSEYRPNLFSRNPFLLTQNPTALWGSSDISETLHLQSDTWKWYVLTLVSPSCVFRSLEFPQLSFPMTNYHSLNPTVGRRRANVPGGRCRTGDRNSYLRARRFLADECSWRAQRCPEVGVDSRWLGARLAGGEQSLGSTSGAYVCAERGVRGGGLQEAGGGAVRWA